MIIKTNIKDFINDNYIDSVYKFKYEINKGLCAKFNGRESFYGYYDCINKIKINRHKRGFKLLLM